MKVRTCTEKDFSKSETTLEEFKFYGGLRGDNMLCMDLPGELSLYNNQKKDIYSSINLAIMKCG